MGHVGRLSLVQVSQPQVALATSAYRRVPCRGHLGSCGPLCLGTNWHHLWFKCFWLVQGANVSPVFHFQIALIIIIINLHNSTVFDLHVGIAILRVQEGLNFTGILADIDDVDNAADGMCKSPSSSPDFSFGEKINFERKMTFILTWIVGFRNGRSVNSDNSIRHPAGTCSSCPRSQQKEES